MDRDRAQIKYLQQKIRAGERGIGWELTFEEWLEWWGDDLDKRGSRRGQLVMMRLHDTGPYALSNIRKGTPLQNAKTRAAVQATKRTMAAYRSIQREIDETPAVADEPPDEMGEDEQWLHENVGWGARRLNTWDLA